MRAAILKETDISMFFFMCLNGYASALQFVLSTGRTGEGRETEGDRGRLGQEVKLLHVPKSWLVGAVDWFTFY